MVLDLSNGFNKIKGIEVVLISLFDNDISNSYFDELDAGIEYHSLGKGRGFDPGILLKLFSLLKRIKADIVHTHINAFEYALPYRIMNRKVRHFHTLHSVAKIECPSKILKSLRWVFYKFRRVVPVTISQICSETFREYYKLNCDNIIFNGRYPLSPTLQLAQIQARYSKANYGHHFLFVNVANIVHLKNQELMIQSLLETNRRTNEKCLLLIIGEHKDAALTQHLKNLSNNNPYIIFTGQQSNIADYLSFADAFCLSSHFEGMPISLVEAFSMGCIPICTPAGGIKNMIDNEVNGFISADFTVESYSNLMLSFIGNRNKPAIMENGKKEFSGKYHIDISISKHLKLYGAIPY